MNKAEKNGINSLFYLILTFDHCWANLSVFLLTCNFGTTFHIDHSRMRCLTTPALAHHMTLHIHPFAARTKNLGHGATPCAGGYATTLLPPQTQRRNRTGTQSTHLSTMPYALPQLYTPLPYNNCLILRCTTTTQPASAILRNSELSSATLIQTIRFLQMMTFTQGQIWSLLPGSTPPSALRKVSSAGATLVRVSPVKFHAIFKVDHFVHNFSPVPWKIVRRHCCPAVPGSADFQPEMSLSLQTK